MIRQEIKEGEMRIKTESDPLKCANYLKIKITKLKWPKVMIKAIGRAIPVLLEAVKIFEDDIIGYRV